MLSARLHTASPVPAAAALAAALVAGAVAWRHGLSPTTLELGAAAVALAVAVRCDCESRIIPDACVGALLAARAAFLGAGVFAGFATAGDVAASLAGAAVVGGGLVAMALISDRLLGAESIGGGDVKLFAAAGAYFGVEGGVAVVLAACLLGLVGERLLGDGSGRFAFGPAIAAAFCLVMVAL